MLARILKKLLLFVALLAVLNFVYRFTLYPKDVKQKYPEAVRLKQSQDSTDIYYFGESSNITFTKDDSSQKSISDFIQDYYPGLKVTAINKYATHAGVYRQWLRQFSFPSKRPKAIVITMNMRSFDAAWRHSKLETQLKEGFVLTRPYPVLINRFLLSLQAFDNKTEKEREREMQHEWSTTKLMFPFPFKYETVQQWDNAMANGGYLNADGSWDMDKIVLSCHYIKAYAFNIADDNERLRDFDAIFQFCTEKGVPLYYNLMAENVQYADSLVGRELVFLMRQNRDILVKRYNKGVCTVVDNLEQVEGNWFIDKKWTTEHYDHRGRMLIARNCADSLKKHFNEHYKPIH
jgi:hypothetical protein